MYEPFLTGVILGAIIGALLTVLIMSLMFSLEIQWQENRRVRLLKLLGLDEWGQEIDE